MGGTIEQLDRKISESIKTRTESIGGGRDSDPEQTETKRGRGRPRKQPAAAAAAEPKKILPRMVDVDITDPRRTRSPRNPQPRKRNDQSKSRSC